MPTSRTVEPIATILALWVGKTLFLFALGTHAIHLAIGNVVFENQTTFCTNLGITTMIRSLTTRRRTDKNRMTGITPVFATSYLFTNWTLFHQNSSINFMSTSKGENLSHQEDSCYNQHNHFPTKFPVYRLKNQNGPSQKQISRAFRARLITIVTG